MAEYRMDSELERYANATHEVGHEVVTCCLKYDGTSKDGVATTIVKVSGDENIDPVFRNALAELTGRNLHCVDFLGLTTVPNKAVARLMENLSEATEKGAAFFIASRPQAPGQMRTTHMCWVNLTGKECALKDVMSNLMVEWNNRSGRRQEKGEPSDIKDVLDEQLATADRPRE